MGTDEQWVSRLTLTALKDMTPRRRPPWRYANRPEDPAQLPLFDAYRDWPKMGHCVQCDVWICGVIASLLDQGIVTSAQLPPPPHGGWPVSAEELKRRDVLQVLEDMWSTH